MREYHSAADKSTSVCLFYACVVRPEAQVGRRRRSRAPKPDAGERAPESCALMLNFGVLFVRHSLEQRSGEAEAAVGGHGGEGGNHDLQGTCDERANECMQ